MLRLDDATFRRDVIGMPASHAAAFKRIAQENECVITSRAVGPTCEQLLAQGYDTKGFRIHGKSCDWGPMAGFVLRDPRLSKYGMDKAAYNRTEHHHALHDTNRAGWKASTVPLRIYRSRIDWLLKKHLIEPTGMGPDQIVGVATHKTGITMPYVLKREKKVPGDVWGVYVKKSSHFQQEDGKRHILKRPELEPLLAMTNPPEHRSWPKDDFRNAVTGDYDLFDVWPLERNYDHDGDDRRMFGTQQVMADRAHIDRIEGGVLEKRFGRRNQATKLGNLTNRVYLIAQLLNSAIGQVESNDGHRSWGPFPKRMVAWHSTESARPYVEDVDLPIIAFYAGLEVAIENIQDFKRFVWLMDLFEYRVLLSEGWVLKPEGKKTNRLGPEFARFVPKWARGPGQQPAQWRVKPWYNA